jgi:3-isopropylmalate/(R)-2-methylmalate dehydratase small subunit
MDTLRVYKITGCAIPVIGDDIDTDRIIPARFLKEITFSKMGDYPFFDERFNVDGSRKAHAFNEAQFQGASILLANVNFGCGSSREHAPQSLLRWGIKAIVAESFAEIFAGNCAMLGIATVVASKIDIAKLQSMAAQYPRVEYSVDLGDMIVTAGNLSIPVSMNLSYRKVLIEGTWDTTRMMLANASRVVEIAARI